MAARRSSDGLSASPDTTKNSEDTAPVETLVGREMDTVQDPHYFTQQADYVFLDDD
jgi:hypothetical protein